MSLPSGSIEDDTLKQLQAKVEQKIRQGLGGEEKTSSHEYTQFKLENTPTHHSLYERAAVQAGKIFAIDPGKSSEKITKYLETAHLNCTAKDATALALLAPIGVFFLSLFLTVIVPALLSSSVSLYYFLFSLLLGLMTYFPLQNMPKFLAQSWRQKASNQMVLAVFYMVTYMRHTSNLELAFEFAADHIGAPLSLDLKKVIWDVETEKYKSVTESMEKYLEQWRGTNREFIEAMHLIMGSLYESSNERRVASLDKSLEVMLDETYEKMLHYAQDLKTPITMLHMLGIILPILGLVILPLAVSFFATNWTIIASFYNILLPLVVFYIGKRVLSSRPTGYGNTGPVIVDEQVMRAKRAKYDALIIIGICTLIGLSPVIIHAVAPGFDIQVGDYSFLQYEIIQNEENGPFGLGAAFTSLVMTLGVGLGLAHYYRTKSKEQILIRNKAKKLETEFASALFLLGNRIADGIPGELAFSKVARNMEGTTAGNFFTQVAINIQKLGMGVQDAIFDEQRGALQSFPSPLIESSMKVLIESSRKGPVEAAKALMSMSTYIKEMHRVNERLRDLLADVLSSMRSQISFLLPTIAGIVIGITSMITSVLLAIQQKQADLGDLGTGGALLDQFAGGIPTYYFQIIVGFYVVQITWVLSYLVSGIENGSDPVSEEWMKGNSLRISSTLYTIIALVVMLIFNAIAGQLSSQL